MPLYFETTLRQVFAGVVTFVRQPCTRSRLEEWGKKYWIASRSREENVFTEFLCVNDEQEYFREPLAIRYMTAESVLYCHRQRASP